MARYTRSLSIALSLSDCLTQLKAVLESCNLEVLFSKEDCIIARETPGQVPFAKLVTIEVLVDSTRATSTITNMDVVVKNEELPLQSNNHCFQIFEQLGQSLNQHPGWQVIPTEVDTAADQHPEPDVQPPSVSSSASTTLSSSSIPQSEVVVDPDLLTLPAQPDQLAPVPLALSEQPQLQTDPIVEPNQPQEPTATDDPQQQSAGSETLPPPELEDSISLESMAQKRSQTTTNLEELRQKRAQSVANLERLRQKRAESIANLEKMRQKREQMFATGERLDGSGDDLNPLDAPEQPSTSQA